MCRRNLRSRRSAGLMRSCLRTSAPAQSPPGFAHSAAMWSCTLTHPPRSEDCAAAPSFSSWYHGRTDRSGPVLGRSNLRWGTTCAAVVAQTSCLPYRGLVVRRTPPLIRPVAVGGFADRKSAIQPTGSLRYETRRVWVALALPRHARHRSDPQNSAIIGIASCGKSAQCGLATRVSFQRSPISPDHLPPSW